jgi:Putative DNA-binding domain
LSATPVNRNLPRVTTFSDLAAILGGFKDVGFHAWSLRVRTVAFKLKDTWYNYATSAALVDGDQTNDKVVPMRDSVLLLDWTEPVKNGLTAHELTARLTHWRTALEMSSAVTFQEHVDLRRNSSDFRSSTWPHWSTQLHEQGGNHLSGPMPDGPYFGPKDRVFGQDIPWLAAQFLGESRFSSQQNAPNEYVLRISDRRARISRLHVESNTLHVEVDNPAQCRLYCSVFATSFAGEAFRDAPCFQANRVSVEFPFSVENLEVWIILEDGDLIDRYEETPHRSTWGAAVSLFNAPRKARLHAIGNALANGENDSVEFKPYIKLLPRDKKAFEVLRAVSGFANMGGGDLYVGVNDATEPVGIETDLNRDYGEKNRDVTSQQAAYEKALRKLINEGTTPTLPVEFHWHDFAHRTILQIRIPQSTVPVHIVETGEIYRRAGGNNKKWRPVDALASADSNSKPKDSNPFGL